MRDAAHAEPRRGVPSPELRLWMESEAEDNADELRRLRRSLRLACEEELTPRQSQMLRMHYEQGRSVSDIARELGVNKSTVSRTLTRAQERLFHCLRFGFDHPELPRPARR